MQSYKGKSAFQGIAVGKIKVVKKSERRVACTRTSDAEAELIRYRKALENADTELEKLSERVACGAGEPGADIFQVHRMILQDGTYNRSVEELVREKRMNVEYAVAATGEMLGQKFAEMPDESMKARAADMRDISERLLRLLEEEKESGVFSRQQAVQSEPVILVAEDLSPSETVQLDRDKVLGFVTVQGSLCSHTAILAGLLGIPALVGAELDLSGLTEGSIGIVDGLEGVFHLNPQEEMIECARRRQREWAEQRRKLSSLVGMESISKDGRRVRLCANIGNVRELKAVRDNDAEGIGLFRSEFLFLERTGFPTEEEQFQVYRTVAEKLEGKQVIIRTLDVGADKQSDYMDMEQEENPALGCRAIRYCFKRPDVFKAQLRALFRAGAFGNIAVMYPMITGVDEVKRIKVLAEEVQGELKAEGLAYGQLKQGIMIETPAAAMMSRELAEEVDFFSIGTNDLTQYTLALDRQNPGVSEFFDAHHPAVLKLIEMTVQNAHEAGIAVGICGELGADTDLTKWFLSIGVDSLSVSPEKLLPLRKVVRETAADC